MRDFQTSFNALIQNPRSQPMECFSLVSSDQFCMERHLSESLSKNLSDFFQKVTYSSFHVLD